MTAEETSHPKVNAKRKSIRGIQDLIDHQLVSSVSKADLEKVAEQFSVAITPSMSVAIDLNNEMDPIKRQFVPSEEELHVTKTELGDPIGDELYTAVKGIIHRYPDRCLFKPVNVCSIYCRFCFRRETVGAGSAALNKAERQQAYQYIEAHPEIWEVILTGGDPLIIKPNLLKDILSHLDAIKTVEVIRFHTRIPVIEPERINQSMLDSLKLQNKPVYIVLHANHPNEFTKEAVQAIASLVDSGIPLLSQSVLLRGVNDNIETLSSLMRTMIKNRIKPYYLHHGDLAKGTRHFRTSIGHGQSLMKKLRRYYSGICQPLYVLDIPGGFGKVPINHSYIISQEEAYTIEDHQGNLHAYQNDITN